MSFSINCPKCGAPSNPSTGICPFCKSTFAPGVSAGAKSSIGHPAMQLIQEAYTDGHLPDALNLMTSMERENPKCLEDLESIALYLNILFECEGPLSKINSLISNALLKYPADRNLHEFLDLSRAKRQLNGASPDSGIQALMDLTQKSPTNYLALFTLGAALQWEKKDNVNAAKNLERCVALRPQLLRAWACLGVAYKGLQNNSLATRAFQKCLGLETDPQMQSYFKSQIA